MDIAHAIYTGIIHAAEAAAVLAVAATAAAVIIMRATRTN